MIPYDPSIMNAAPAGKSFRQAPTKAQQFARGLAANRKRNQSNATSMGIQTDNAGNQVNRQPATPFGVGMNGEQPALSKRFGVGMNGEAPLVDREEASPSAAVTTPPAPTSSFMGPVQQGQTTPLPDGLLPAPQLQPPAPATDVQPAPDGMEGFPAFADEATRGIHRYGGRRGDRLMGSGPYRGKRQGEAAEAVKRDWSNLTPAARAGYGRRPAAFP